MKKIFDLIKKQYLQSNNTINLIASENYSFEEIRKIDPIIFYSKYAEGEIGKRYYNGCKIIDEIECIAQNEFNKLFNCKYSNVQLHSGTLANLTVMLNLLNIGDTILSLNLKDGGHLSHGFKSTATFKMFNIVNYHISENGIDYFEIQELIKTTNCKLIIVGYSSCVFDIDYKKIRNMIDKASRKIYLLADIAHISGLIASNLMTHPFPFADVITTTTHKQLRGPRGAAIGWNDEKLSFKSFPIIQGGPDLLSLTAKSITFTNCNKLEYKNYCKQIILNSQAFYDSLKKYFEFTHPKTKNHMMIFKIDDAKQFADELEKHRIIVNYNFLPEDKNSKIPSGIRVGVNALTTRGAKTEDFELLAKAIYAVYKNQNPEKYIDTILSKLSNII